MTEVQPAPVLFDALPDGPPGETDWILVGIPDLNGSVRGKALRPAAFETVLDEGLVMTDLLLALDPIVETTADHNSYGFRPMRSTADAIEQCFKLLSRKSAPV